MTFLKFFSITVSIAFSVTGLMNMSFSGANVISENSGDLHAATDPDVTVGMTNLMTFEADTVRIEVGETVRWENTSMLAHSVTADPSESTVEGSAKLPEGAETFNSGMMDPEETFSHTFDVPGTYKYFCMPHEGANMFGWVIVEKQS